MMTIYTIGHSTRSLAEVLDLLRAAGGRLRTVPTSELWIRWRFGRLDRPDTEPGDDLDVRRSLGWQRRHHSRTRRLFGATVHSRRRLWGDMEAACANCVASLKTPYQDVETAYVAGWRSWCSGLTDLSAGAGEAASLYYLSAMVLKAHEDEENPGAHIASLATPWGESEGDSDAGGYHLVWPRDLYHSATARLAAGDVRGASAALRYLLHTQRADGSWPQNFWVYGAPYWPGLQLDELGFPILLAW